MEPNIACGFLYSFSPTCTKMISTLGYCGVCFLLISGAQTLLFWGFPSLLKHTGLISFKCTNNLLSSYNEGGILPASWKTEKKIKYGS